MEVDLSKDEKKVVPSSATIKTHLQRAFGDKANEELPDDLLALIGKLRDQDEHDEK